MSKQQWKDADEHNKAAIKEHKLRVNFLPYNESSEQHAAAKSQRHASETANHLNPDDAATFGTPSAPRTSDRPVSAISSTTPAAARYSEPSENAAESRQRSTSSAYPPEEESPKNTTSLQKELGKTKQQLQEAQALVGKLRDQIADQGLRQRKTTTGSSNHDTDISEKQPQDVQQQQLMQQEQGVALHIVAILCFSSFLIAYLFF